MWVKLQKEMHIYHRTIECNEIINLNECHIKNIKMESLGEYTNYWAIVAVKESGSMYLGTYKNYQRATEVFDALLDAMQTKTIVDTRNGRTEIVDNISQSVFVMPEE